MKTKTKFLTQLTTLAGFGRYLWTTKKRIDFGRYHVVKPAEISARKSVPDRIVKPCYYETGEPDGAPELPEIKNEGQISSMRDSCRLAARILQQVGQYIEVGKSTDDLDSFVHDLTIKNNAYPSPLNYKNFPKSICTSVNNVACHGIPDSRALQNGDIINVDITVFFNGYHGDCSKTFLVGDVDEVGAHLVKATEVCLNEAIAVCKPGQFFRQIGATIEEKAAALGYSVIPCFVGHGIGEYFHGPPDICHFANHFPGRMEAGMTFTIEPVLGNGENEIEILEDGWTAVTIDNSRTAQFEHTVLITEDGVEVLTLP